MKRLIIGDMHGHYDTVEKIYNKEQPDEVIMVGDYVDSRSVNTDDQYDAFQNLLMLADNHHSKNKGKFIMLIGNHDFHYMTSGEQYSGFNWRTSSWAGRKFNILKESGILQYVYIDNVNKTIYSHAGVSNYWLKNRCQYEVYGKEYPDLEDINTLSDMCFTFSILNGYSPTGDTTSNGPLWIRPRSLSSDLYEDKDGVVWYQIVGHTHLKHCCYIDTADKKTTNKIIVVDALPVDYLVQTIDDNGIIINTDIIQNEV